MSWGFVGGLDTQCKEVARGGGLWGDPDRGSRAGQTALSGSRIGDIEWGERA